MRQLKKTGITNLWRNEKGIYYLVAKISGRRVVRSLKTADKSLARVVLPDRLREEKEAAAREAGTVRMSEGQRTAEGTWAAVMGRWVAYQAGRPDLQERTREYYADVASYGLAELSGEQGVAVTSRVEMEEWWGRVATRWAESTANNVLSAVQGALRLYEEGGGRVPQGLMAGCRKLRLPVQDLVVPTDAEMEAILMEVESTGRATSAESRDLIEFLSYVGCRIGEARAVRWGDVSAEEVVIRGPENARGRARTKGGGSRRVPTAPRIARLLERRRFAGVRAEDFVFGIKSPKKGLEGACRRLGLPHLRVHDLRHFFATHCIERGVDIPTVAGWLGHKDGGVLAMRIYGHVRNAHSMRMGRRIG